MVEWCFKKHKGGQWNSVTSQSKQSFPTTRILPWSFQKVHTKTNQQRCHSAISSSSVPHSLITWIMLSMKGFAETEPSRSRSCDTRRPNLKALHSMAWMGCFLRRFPTPRNPAPPPQRGWSSRLRPPFRCWMGFSVFFLLGEETHASCFFFGCVFWMFLGWWFVSTHWCLLGDRASNVTPLFSSVTLNTKVTHKWKKSLVERLQQYVNKCHQKPEIVPPPHRSASFASLRFSQYCRQHDGFAAANNWSVWPGCSPTPKENPASWPD